MISSVYSKEVNDTIDNARKAYLEGRSKVIDINGSKKTIPYPFHSPEDWRDCSIYFLMVDRFNNPKAPPKHRWNSICRNWQGGTINGVREQLQYIQELGLKAIWISPVLKQPNKSQWMGIYHGYGAQNFLEIDSHYGTDQDLIELIEEAHAMGLYIILDIVLDHSGHVFDYVYNGRVTDNFKDEDILNGPSGCEPPVLWLDSTGRPRRDWKNIIPEGTNLSPDDAIYPNELRNYLFYRRRGEKISDEIQVEADPDNSFVKGDFSVMRQFAVEFDAALPGNESIRDSLGTRPVLSILSRIYQYIIAKYDIDGFRIDTVKHVHPSMVETFGNSIREFALSIGKKNFFIFGEIYDNEDIISKFVGRNSTEVDSFGIDAALDFCVFYKLPGVAKSILPVEDLRNTFEYRRQVQIRQLSTHGETGRFFVTFLDNHDICSRFNEPGTSIYQVLLGITLLFTLQGIPCLYYGTEQGFQGAKDERGKPLLIYPESVREAMWGSESKFDRDSNMYREIRKIAGIKNYYAPLRYGRFYFRELSANGKDFGQSFGIGGIVAFSRVLWNDEVLVVANTSTTEVFKGFVIIDRDINLRRHEYSVVYSNMGSKRKSLAEVGDLNIWSNGEAFLTKSAKLYIEISPMEVQILAGF